MRLQVHHGAADERRHPVGRGEHDPGTWLYHCHVESHMAAGMIGTYRVMR
jgi:hypothetical protein